MIDKTIRKQLLKYIKAQLSKGYSIDSIRKVLVRSGYSETFADSLIKTNRKNVMVANISLLAVFALVFAGLGLLFADVAPVGLVVLNQQSDYSDSISMSVNETYRYNWTMDEPGMLESIRLDGSISRFGSAKVYLEHNNESYLIFDSLMLDREIETTEWVVADEPDGGDLIMNNLSNGSEITISISGGGIKPIDGVFAFDIRSSFNRSVDESKLCTKWSVNLYDICYGSDDCCALIGLESSRDWDDRLYLSYGRYGSGLYNTVRAQVIYADYSLDIGDAYSDIVYSSVKEALVEFQDIVEFSDFCADTCLLPYLNDTGYVLLFEIEGAELNIDNIIYSASHGVNVSLNAPSLINEFDDIILYGVKTLDISSYFYDEDDDMLTYSFIGYSGVDVEIKDSIATIMPVADYTGEVFMFFTASDGYYNTTSNMISIRVVDEPIDYSEAEVNEELIKPRVVINKPVKWVKVVNVSSNVMGLRVNISSDALNVSVKDIDDRVVSENMIKVNDSGVVKNASVYRAEKRIDQIEKISDKLEDEKSGVIMDDPTSLREVGSINRELMILKNEKNKLTGYVVSASGEGWLTRLVEWLFDVDITGYAVKENYKLENEKTEENEGYVEVIVEDIVSDVEVEYYTQGPTAEEEDISNGKRIVVSSDVHYTDILAYTYLGDVSKSSINLYWLVNGGKELVEDVVYYDENNNTLIDYIEWIVPSLSNQTYELIIEIASAEHLDSNRSFVADVYDLVSVRDGNYSLIHAGDYLRVTFETALDNTKDITLYAKSDESSFVEVYEEDSDVVLMVFSVDEDNEYKKYLTLLDGEQSVFDLKSFGDVWFDYVVDPTIGGANGTIDFVDPTPDNGSTQSDGHFEVNVSMWFNQTGYGLDKFTYDFDGTNYTMYNDSLIVMYNLNNLSELSETNSLVVDLAGGNNNGSVTGGSFVDGKYDSTLSFTGSNHIVTSNLPSMTQATFSAWVKRTGAGESYPRILGWVSNHFDIADYNHEGTLGIYPASGGWQNTGQSFGTDWNHISVAYNTTHFLVYWNGGLINTYTKTGTLGTSAYIGATSSGSERWVGLIDEVRIYNQSLDAGAIKTLYMSNLKKINQTNWEFYINQSLNSTDSLADGDYTYQAYASDKRGNSNQTEERVIIISGDDITAPLFSGNKDNASSTTYNGTDVQLNLTITDNIELSNYRLTTNDTLDGTWVNESIISTSDVSVTVIFNYSIKNFSLAGGAFGWRVWANDSSGNSDVSSIYSLVVQDNTPDTTPPSYNNFANNGSAIVVGGVVNWSINISDEIGLSHYIFAHNDSGTLVNVSNGTLSGIISFVNTTITISSTSGDYVCGQYWFNDSSGNVNSTLLTESGACFTVNNTVPAVPTVDYPVNGNNYTDIPYINYSSTDADSDSLTYNVYINGSLNVTTTTNVTDWNASDGYYNLTVSASDGSDSSSNSTVVQFTLDTTAPIISGLINTSTTNISSYIEWSCDEACNYTILWYNSTSLVGSIGNDTFATSHNPFLSSLLNSTNYKINLTVYDVVGNPVVNNTFNFTTAENIAVVDSISPYYNNFQNNGSTITKIGGVVNWSIDLVDNVGLSNYYFAHNQTGTLSNQTLQELSGTSQSINDSLTITLSQGNNICGQYWFNDSSNNVNQTDLSCFTVINTEPTTPTISYPVNLNNYSDIPYINYSSSDADSDTITYQVYINSTLNITTTTNITDWNASDGFYNLSVTANDGINSSSNSTIVQFILDTTSPIISNLRNTSTTNESSYIEWSCNEACNYTILWYNSSDLVGTINNNTFATSHNPYLISLLDSTNYKINLTVYDVVGNPVVNNTFNFTTAENIILDTTPPTYNNFTNNGSATVVGGVVNWSINISDETALSYYIFAHNDSGTLVNVSNGTLSGTNSSINSTITITLTSGDYVCGQYWFNDSSGNVNSTLLTESGACFTVNNTVPAVPTVDYPVNGNNYTDIPYINYSSSDADGTSLTYNIYINGSLNVTTTTNITDWNASDGYYNLTVSALDGSDSSANSSSVLFNLDATKPSFSLNSTNASSTTYNGTDVQLNLTISDNLGLSNYRLSVNDTSDGGWVNESIIPTSGSSVGAIFNYSVNNLSLAGGTLGWRVWANDSMGNSNVSDIYTLVVQTTPDTTLPTYNNFVNNGTATIVNGVVNWSIDILDETALDYYLFAHNDSGSLVNVSNGTLSGMNSFVNTTVTITSTSGDYVCGQYWFNDSSGNVNSTLLTESGACFTVNNSAPSAPSIIYPVDGNSYLDIPYINYSSSDADDDILTYNIYINGTLNISGISSNVTDWNASDGYYNLTVSADDGGDSSANSSSIFFTLDSIQPSFTSNSTNASSTTYNGTEVQLNLTITDGFGLSNYRLTTNDTSDGIWVNESIISTSGVSVGAIFNYSIKNFSLAGGIFGWMVWANDSAGNNNISGTYTFVVQDNTPDTTSPTYNNFANNGTATVVGGVVNWSINISDETGLNFYIFAHNDSGSLVNVSNGSLLGTNMFVNATATISSTNGAYVCGQYWFNDSSGNVNSTLLTESGACFTVNNTVPSVPTVTYPVNLNNYSDIPYINYSSSDADSDAITYNVYINGSLNITTTTNITDWNASDGFYNVSVTASDGTDSSANSSSIFFTLDSIQPSFTSNSTNASSTTYNGADVQLNLTISDNIGLSNYRLTTNDTSDGSWVNESLIIESSSSVGAIFNYSITNFPVSGGTFGWRVWANDSAGNSNVSIIYTFVVQTIPDATPPTYNNFANNGTLTKVNDVVNWSINISDEIGLSHYIFAHNDSGTLVNVSNGTISGMNSFVNTTVTITSTSGDYVCGQYWFNDSTGNVNSTLLTESGACFTVNNSIPVVSSVDYPVGGENYTDIPYINYSSSDADSDSLIYNVYINGSLNISGISSNVTDWNASDGYYNLTVSAWDGTDSSFNSSSVLFRIDSTAPSWYGNQTNATLMKINGNATFNMSISDGLELDYYVFSWNGTGEWDNVTGGGISGSSIDLVVNKSTNLSQGNTIGYMWYANDSLGNMNNSLLRTFIIINTIPITPTVDYPINGDNYTDIPYINYSSSDADSDSLTYNVYINGSLNVTTTTNITDWNASDGYYNLTVSVSDGIDNSANSSSVLFRLDTIEPSFSGNKDNSSSTTYNGTDVQLNLTVIDNSGLSNYRLITNDTSDGVWVNESIISTFGSSVGAIFNYSIKNFSLTGGTFGWMVWANDTVGNSNVSDIYTFVVQDNAPDTTPPTYNNFANNGTATIVGGVVNWSINISDETGLNSYIFAHNDSGSLVNVSNGTLSGTNEFVNATVTISSTNGAYICGQYWFNDSSGNVNSTLLTESEACFTVNNTVPAVPTINYPVDGMNYSDIPYINYSSSDADSDTLTYSLYINGSLNITTTTNVTDWNASDGYYNLTVSVDDGSDSSANSSSILFRIDNIAPTWDELPVNITLEYIHNSLSIDFNASDSSGVDSYFINNTVYFYMNSTSGVLQNNGTINRGNYTLNISVNDTLGNLNYTNFLVIVQDTRFPNITSKGPSGPLSLTIVNMSVITDENASCKYISSTEGNSTVNYTSMNNSFSDMETYHQVNLTLTVGDHLYFVRCIDDLGLVMNVSENISFSTFTPTTSVDSSGGGGGGGRVIGVIGNVTRVASVDLVSPKSISISEKGRVDIPISIKNDGDLSLSDIKVEIIGDLDGAVLSLSKDHISTLSIGSSEEIILTVNIESLENFGTYPITISVIVESADLHVSEKIYLDIVDSYAKDKTQVDEELSPKGEILELPSPEDSGKRNMFVFIPVIIILLGLISSLVIYSRNNHIANQESDMIEKRLVFVLDELRKSIDQRLVEAARYHYLEIINLFARVNSSSMTYPKKQRYYYEINQLRNELNSIIGKS